ncbi:MAG: SDR family oxidoreductase [Bacteroidota bacterium]|nr:SDR family oxidoreductase [Bacteroidota bacterium]
MDLQIKGKLFVVCGAGSGLGQGVAHALLEEEAYVIGIGRSIDKLDCIAAEYDGLFEPLVLDLKSDKATEKILNKIEGRILDGVFINAGGPPARSFMETVIEDWDEAYQSLLRWKVVLVKALLPLFREQKYGRILFSESQSVKQPIPFLVLSTSLRLAVVGIAKELANEVAREGITVNVLAPGSHNTGAMERLIQKRMDVEHVSMEEARKATLKEIPVGFMGDANDFGSLAAWLLSPLSRYVTGQTLSIDGGMINGIFG